LTIPELCGEDGEVYTLKVVIHVPAAIIVAGGQPTRDNGMGSDKYSQQYRQMKGLL